MSTRNSEMVDRRKHNVNRVDDIKIFSFSFSAAKVGSTKDARANVGFG